MHVKTVGDFRRAVRLGAYAWPGGYALFGVTDDGGTICAPCMAKERRVIVSAIGDECSDGWRIVAVDCVANTDGQVRCDHCDDQRQAEWSATDDTTAGNISG